MNKPISLEQSRALAREWAIAQQRQKSLAATYNYEQSLRCPECNDRMKTRHFGQWVCHHCLVPMKPMSDKHWFTGTSVTVFWTRKDSDSEDLNV